MRKTAVIVLGAAAMELGDCNTVMVAGRDL